jgi:hypothetical protein
VPRHPADALLADRRERRVGDARAGRGVHAANLQR